MVVPRNRLLTIALTCATVGLLGAAYVFGCRVRSAPAPDHITLFVTGDSRGYLEPCGCRRDQAGGLSGRATLIGSKKPAERLVLDVGNLTSGGRPYEILKLGYMMEGMSTIGYDAV